MEDKILLVNLKDEVVGTISKMDAHTKPMLHSAFSVFIYSGGKLLLQKRNINKYHSGGLWANSLCSHPRANMSFDESVKVRAKFELGIDNLKYKQLFKFVYLTKFSENLYEYEYDHVIVSNYNGKVNFNPDEIEEVKWVGIEELAEDLVSNPTKYASWFLICAPKVIEYLRNKNTSN